MNRQIHAALGLIAFAPYGYVFYQLVHVPMDIIIFAGAAAYVGSLLPDLLEPSGDWRHRGFAHSKRVLWKLLPAFIVISILALLLQHLLILSAAILGYVLHLLADSVTPVGMPD